MRLIKWVVSALLLVVGELILIFGLPWIGLAVGSRGFVIGAMVLAALILIGLYLLRRNQ